MKTSFFNNCLFLGLVGFCLLQFAACNGRQASTSTSKYALELTNQKWIALPPVTTANLRGLHAVDDERAWASGSNGTVLRTTDWGGTWEVMKVEGADSLDFRDIHALDRETAVVLSAGYPAYIYKTIDGGDTWQQTYFNDQEGVFFDGFDFTTPKEGIAFSDPIDGRLFIIKTVDGADTWQPIDTMHLPKVLEGEAGYAASGTGVVFRDEKVWIATGGGERARVFYSEDAGTHWQVFDTPIVSAAGKGIFSMTMIDDQNGVVVGGAYMDSTNNVRNCAITQDGGKTWELIEENQPNGYRSCVAGHATEKILIAVGRTGSEISINNGKSWTRIGEEGYFSCGITENKVWAVGRGGKMAYMKLNLP